MKQEYDYIVVGSGLFGAVFTRQALNRGKKCLVVEKRPHIGGNIYTELIEDIHVHTYGAHIFHTSIKSSWDYIRQFAEFNHFINSPIANFKGEIYNLPFNMNTFHQMWGVITPDEAKTIINSQQEGMKGKPQNLEEHAVSLVGKDIYERLIKGYTEKQWGRACRDLPVEIMRRIPIRYIYDNNYYDTPYQGIPKGGYTSIIKQMLKGADVFVNTDFLKKRKELSNLGQRIIFTGTIDSYYNYCFGALEYRGLKFKTELLDRENYQGNAVINYTERDIPYTRIIEHKHFEFGSQKKTVITREYPIKWEIGMEPYYPINDIKNDELYNTYLELSQKEKNVIFGGRLGSYKYYDMGEVIKAALTLAENEFE